MAALSEVPDVYYLEASNMSVKLTNFGAKIMEIKINPRFSSSSTEPNEVNNQEESSEVMIDVALGYDTVQEYVEGT